MKHHTSFSLFILAAALLPNAARAAHLIADGPEHVTPLTAGVTAPTGVVRAADGPYDLGEVLAHKPTILVFYSSNGLGNRALADLRDGFPIYESLGYQVIAISTDAPESLREAEEKNHTNYPLLSDRDLALAASYGIAFRAPNGADGAAGLLVPTVFVVDRSGVIRWVYSNPHRNATRTQIVAAAVRAIK